MLSTNVNVLFDSVCKYILQIVFFEIRNVLFFRRNEFHFVALENCNAKRRYFKPVVS